MGNGSTMGSHRNCADGTKLYTIRSVISNDNIITTGNGTLNNLYQV